MMKQILTSLSDEKLTEKIANIKTEQKRMENALKQYEAELERRKQKVPLGVPVTASDQTDRNHYYTLNSGLDVYKFTDEDDEADRQLKNVLNFFKSEESAKKHAEMLLAWRKALVANAKGEPIDIKVLLPLLSKGWVCCTEFGYWLYSKERTTLNRSCIIDRWEFKEGYHQLDEFNLKTFDGDWKDSLMECGL